MTNLTTQEYIVILKKIDPFLGQDISRHCKTCGGIIPNYLLKAGLKYCLSTHAPNGFKDNPQKAGLG